MENAASKMSQLPYHKRIVYLQTLSLSESSRNSSHKDEHLLKKWTYPQTIQDVEKFVSSWEQIWSHQWILYSEQESKQWIKAPQ